MASAVSQVSFLPFVLVVCMAVVAAPALAFGRAAKEDETS